MLDRYGDELEIDFLREYNGADLGQIWRSRCHRKLSNMIHRLPQASLYYSAIANDKEHVAALLEATKGQPQTHVGPDVADWDTQTELLARIVDAVRDNTGITMAVNGVSPPKTKPVERPSTAFEEVRAEQRKATADRLNALVLPKPPVE